MRCYFTTRGGASSTKRKDQKVFLMLQLQTEDPFSLMSLKVGMKIGQILKQKNPEK